MMRLIAFEGAIPAGAIASWHAGIVQDEQGVLNPVTGRRFTASRFDELADEGHLTQIRPVELPRLRAQDQPVVYLVTKGTPECPQFRVNTSKYGPYVEPAHTPEHYVWVFARRTIFDWFRNEKQDAIVSHILTSLAEDAAAAASLARAGLSLGRGHAALNAAWVHFTPPDRQALVSRLADAGVVSAGTKERFQLVLAAMSADHAYTLKYDGGVAEGGGLDVDAAADTLGTLRELHPSLASEVAQEYGFLAANQVPQLHLQELMAASASLKFSVRAKGSLRDQVARYLELSVLESCIAGKVPDRLAEDGTFGDALDRLLHPSDQTTVKHTPLGQMVPVGVHRTVSVDTAEVVRTDAVRVFCFLIGIYQNSERAEVMVASPFRRRSGRVTFSLRDRGDGTRPEGLELFDEGNDFLYRPFVVSLERQILDNGTERHLLQDAVCLSEGRRESIFTAIPSSVVPGAFVVGREYKVRLLPTDDLETPFWREHLEKPRKDRPRDHMLRFMAEAARAELARANDNGTSWLPPARPPVPSAADRCVVSLSGLGGAAAVGDLLDALHDRYNVVLTASNTLSVCKEARTLFHIEEEDGAARLTLTDEGKSHAAVFRRAGGDAGTEVEE